MPFAPSLPPQEIAPPAATAAVDADGNPIDSEAAAAAAAAGSSSGPSQVLKHEQEPKYLCLDSPQKVTIFQGRISANVIFLSVFVLIEKKTEGGLLGFSLTHSPLLYHYSRIQMYSRRLVSCVFSPLFTHSPQPALPTIVPAAPRCVRTALGPTFGAPSCRLMAVPDPSRTERQRVWAAMTPAQRRQSELALRYSNARSGLCFPFGCCFRDEFNHRSPNQ
jgi:hypothetical protein